LRQACRTACIAFARAFSCTALRPSQRDSRGQLQLLVYRESVTAAEITERFGLPVTVRESRADRRTANCTLG